MSELRDKIYEAVSEAMNEISPEKVGAAFVAANNYQRNPEKTHVKNGRVVDSEYEAERKRRQKNAFGKKLAQSLAMADGNRGDTFRANERALKKEIEKYEERLKDPRLAYGERESYENAIEHDKERLQRMYYDTLGYDVSGDQNGTYQVSFPGGSAYSHPHGSGFNYVQPRYTNQAAKLTGVTDKMVGYDDKLTGRLDKEMDYLQRRKKNVQNAQQYRKDKDDYERRKMSAEREMDAWKSKNPISRMFSKKPNEFTEEPPVEPEWDKKGGGYYFTGEPEDYDEMMKRQMERNSRYRNAINETEVTEFTPYTPEQAARNRAALFDRRTFSDDAYLKAKHATEERMAAKKAERQNQQPSLTDMGAEWLRQNLGKHITSRAALEQLVSEYRRFIGAEERKRNVK